MSAPRGPLLKSISLTDFLSFGPGTHTIELDRLNVLIGPNGSGKSNLVEAIAILRAAPKDVAIPIRRGGGVRHWLWKGNPETAESAIEAVFNEIVDVRNGSRIPAIRFRFVFGSEGESFVLMDERIETEAPSGRLSRPRVFFGYEKGRPFILMGSKKRKTIDPASVDNTKSILSQRADPDIYPELSGVARSLDNIALYRKWSFGPASALRRSCDIDVPRNRLSELLDNLPVRLAAMKKNPEIKRKLIRLLAELSPGFDDIEIVPEGGQMQLYLIDGSQEIPARRLSDGTLRYLCLLAILLDEAPPPLIVIEEPELGLHPDVLPTLRDLIVEASSRCQLVVTTHSTSFLDAFTDHADSVLVCEKPDASTLVRRLRQGDIDRMRDGRGLGGIWMSGELGGTRW